mmetsp:Transcript_47715/g.102225  ORF Transcript_47715/g.102225 Transcript_47715/m.102225 type:complete len:256 (+) Transcript_47715:152-919(+)|eukprot:CAMPEP_0206486884 /NCGR_PEP_ID=MMETSP0324_2-20121206/41289_1 /ASSEMBLY_ACC=CAM_ASM_000836 /TAXON_ID=2866 /ORGANISM="Crypthecodinium cohnii, Strain Seligo" /LENGTH=255 /DNA_ID=CAMNT_0053965215 /DNA_START=83 /DNA_END=850 /DNA_ORIENTATION=-
MTAEQRFFMGDEDRVNCPFYFKIGSCRNGDRCNRVHTKPTSSQTVLISHLYPNLPESMTIANDEDWDDDTYAMAQEHVEYFFQEVFLELAKYGEIEDMVVLDNVSEHMVGNVYCKYYREADAAKAVAGLDNRFYGGQLIQAEHTPVTEFREARCRAFHETRCARGGLCNFMHVKHVPKAIKRKIVREMYDAHPEFTGPGARYHAERERSRSRERKDTQPARQTDEERRKMIAQWNLERANSLKAQVPIPAPRPLE